MSTPRQECAPGRWRGEGRGRADGIGHSDHPQFNPIDPETLLIEIPAAMQAARRWLLWRAVPAGPGKKTRKVPHYASGAPRQGRLDTLEDLARLANMAEAIEAYLAGPGQYAGLGFAMGGDGGGGVWQGIDLDHSDTRQELAALAEELPGYRETSPSGTGVHAIGYGAAFPALGANASGIEAYAAGRYLTVTGAALGGDVEDLAPFVGAVLAPRHGRAAAAATQERPALEAGPALLAELRDALSHIDPDPRDTWVRMAHALHGLGSVGADLWDAWSRGSGKYDATDARRVWDSCAGQRTDHRAVFAEAARQGWHNPRHGPPQPPLEREWPGVASDSAGLAGDDAAPVRSGLPPELAALARAGGGRRDWDPGRLRGAMEALDPVDDLILVVRALHHASGGSLAGLDLVLGWVGADLGSEQRAAAAAAWAGLAAAHRHPLTARSLYRLARRQGWDGLPFAPPPPPLVNVPLAGMGEARPPAVTYVVDPLLPRRHVTLLGAHGGAGKSIWVLGIAAHVATGRWWAGCPVEAGRVLYLSLEDDGELVRDRLARTCRAYGLDPAEVASRVQVLDGTGGDTALVDEVSAYGVRRLVETRLLDELRDAAQGYDLVIVDNASDAFGGDENDRQQVRTFVRLLARIARTAGAAVLLLAHVDKAAARHGAARNSYSGSTAWHNSSRSRLALVEAGDGIELRQEKLNLAKQANPIPLAWTPEGVLVPVTGQEAGPAADLRAALDAEDDAALVAALGAARGSGVTVPTGRTGPANTQIVLCTVGLPLHLHGARGRVRFWAAINRLVRIGVVRRETYRTADSKERERWTL